MSNKGRTTFYIGVTSDLESRISQHKGGRGSAFTRRVNLHDLVYFEELPDIVEAIYREKQLKRWHREWKINLIKSIKAVRV